jgi:hypothetical protein
MLEPVTMNFSRSAMEFYSIPHRDVLVFSDALLHARPLILRDQQYFMDDVAAREEIRQYIDKGFYIFQSKIRVLHSQAEPLSNETEKELHFMLEALIEAKRMIDQQH